MYYFRWIKGLFCVRGNKTRALFAHLLSFRDIDQDKINGSICTPAAALSQSVWFSLIDACDSFVSDWKLFITTSLFSSSSCWSFHSPWLLSLLLLLPPPPFSSSYCCVSPFSPFYRCSLIPLSSSRRCVIREGGFAKALTLTSNYRLVPPSLHLPSFQFLSCSLPHWSQPPVPRALFSFLPPVESDLYLSGN